MKTVPNVPHKNPQNGELNGELKGIEIFKAGQHKAMSGRSANYPTSMLQQVVANFNSLEAQVPVVVGHPKTDAPAYGWVTELYVDGDILKADIGQVDEAFVAMVKAGRYKNISASFWSPNSPSNPAAGKFTLKHVGFLGAAAPAVKGLKPVEFAKDATGVIEFGEEDLDFSNPHLTRALQRFENQKAMEDLIGAGKVLPCFAEDLLCFIECLDNTEVISFAGGNEFGPRDWLLDYLGKQLPIVSFGAFDMDEDQKFDQEAGNIPNGYTATPDANDFYNRAKQLSKTNDISLQEAAKRLGR